MYLDGFGKRVVFFGQKYFFTLFKKKKRGQKITFLAISQKMRVLAKNLTI